MANFDKALEQVLLLEGIYSNDPDDLGKETFCGISRAKWPGWAGWNIVDSIKECNDGPIFIIMADHYRSIPTLPKLVKSFYKSFFWNRIYGDDINSDLIAEALFNQSINMGIDRSVINLQRSINILNRNSPDIEVDGKFGPITLIALNETAENDEKYLLKLINILQGSHYAITCESNLRQKKYIRGWLNRINFNDCT